MEQTGCSDALHIWIVTEGEPNADAGAVWDRRYVELWPILNRAVAATMGTYEGVEDAVQEAFIAGMRHEPDQIGNVAGWLYTVALRKLRRAKRRDVAGTVLRFARTSPSHEFDLAIERIDLLAALRSLPARHRELLVAKYYLGLTQQEIACVFRVPRGTVSSGLSRALAALRALERARG